MFIQKLIIWDNYPGGLAVLLHFPWYQVVSRTEVSPGYSSLYGKALQWSPSLRSLFVSFGITEDVSDFSSSSPYNLHSGLSALPGLYLWSLSSACFVVRPLRFWSFTCWVAPVLSPTYWRVPRRLRPWLVCRLLLQSTLVIVLLLQSIVFLDLYVRHSHFWSLRCSQICQIICFFIASDSHSSRGLEQFYSPFLSKTCAACTHMLFCESPLPTASLKHRLLLIPWP